MPKKMKQWVIHAVASLPREIVVEATTEEAAIKKALKQLHGEYLELETVDDENYDYDGLTGVQCTKSQSIEEYKFSRNGSFAAANRCPSCEEYSENCAVCGDCDDEDVDNEEDAATYDYINVSTNPFG